MSLEKIFKLSVLVNMIDKMTGPARKIGAAVDDNVSKLDKWEQKFGSLNKNGLQTAGVGAAITAATTGLAKSTFATSKALGELSSLGVKDLQTLSNAGRDFSNEWAGTIKADFISAAYDIKSGISSLTDEGVAEYTKIAGLTAKATKASTSQMTDLFATGYGIYKGYYSDMSDMQFAEMFGAGVAKSVQTFKTDGSKLAESISTLGASATTANVPLEEQLSVLGMLQATMGGSEAGTKYKAFLKSAAKAGETLGLSFLDANNQLLSMPDIIGQLRTEFGDTMDAAEKMKLTEAFGTEEAVAAIDLLYGKTGDLQGNIEALYDSMGQGAGQIKDMANAINDTDASQYELMNQQMQNLKEDLGTAVMPTFRKMLSAVGSTVQTISEWIQKHQRLTATLLVAVTVFGVMLTGIGIGMVVIGSLGVVITSLIRTVIGLKRGIDVLRRGALILRPVLAAMGGAFKAMGLAAFGAGKKAALGMAMMAKHAIRTAVTAMPGLIASVWAFTAALLVNPIVLGIAALIAGVIALYRNWDKVTALMRSAWAGFCSGVFAGVEYIKQGFSAAAEFITGKLEWFRTAGGKIITTLTDGIKSMAMKPVNAVKDIFAKVRKLLPFSDAKEGPLSQLTLSGSRIMTTMAAGMQSAEDLPAEQAKLSFGGIAVATRKEVKKIKRPGAVRETTSTTKTDSGKKTIIQKLILNVDISKIKDLQSLFKLVEELQDLDNSSDGDGDVEMA